jgi:hypothetical protein
MMTRVGLSIVVGATLLASARTTLAQDDDTYKSDVLARLSRSDRAKTLRDVRFANLTDGTKVGYIRLGRSQDAEFDLVQGYAYAFVGVCDRDCTDLDLALYDPDGRKVTEHTGIDDAPVVWFLAAQSGRYRVRATAPKCDAFIGCYWALQALWK